jgi:hypothetical protein
MSVLALAGLELAGRSVVIVTASIPTLDGVPVAADLSPARMSEPEGYSGSDTGSIRRRARRQSRSTASDYEHDQT